MATRTYTVGSDSGVRRLDNLTGPWFDIPLNLLSNSGKVFLSVLRDVKTDPNNGDKVFVVGGHSGGSGINGIYYSNNAGAIWNHVGGNITSGIYSFSQFYEVWPVDSNVIYACGDNGYVFKSTDGGLTFDKTVTLPTFTGLADPLRSSYALHFISPLIGVVSLDDYIYKTIDGGATWNALNGGLNLGSQLIVGIHLSADQQTIVALAQDGIWQSTDAGVTWTERQALVSRNGMGLHLTWIDDNNLWVLCGGDHRLVSNNAGLSWTIISPVGSGPDNKAGHLYSPTDGFFSQDNDILSTVNSFVSGIFSETSLYGIEAVWTHLNPPPQEPCGCPEGFTYNWETKECDGYNVVPIIVNGQIYDVVAGNQIINYGANGAVFYDNIDASPKPIYSNATTMLDNYAVPIGIQGTVSNDAWGDVQLPDTLNGRLIEAGIWADVPLSGSNQDPLYEWIGYTACIEIAQTKVYYIGVGSDNLLRFKLDGIEIINLLGCTGSFNFGSWHVFPLTINAGTHIITIEGKNCQDFAAFALEIYDATLGQLLAMTLSAQIDAVAIFSTKNKIGSTFDLGELSGFSCPEGWTLSVCNNAYQCVRTESVPFEPCGCYLATDCSNPQNTVYITTDTPLDTNLIYEFVEYPDICWSVQQSTGCEPNAPYNEIVASHVTCLRCLGACYILTDCQSIQSDIIVSNDLSLLIGQVIKIESCPDVCWLVSQEVLCGEIENIVVITDTYATCNECLPGPAPEPPLVLNPRRIKPGYNPPACDIDYLRKVNCNLAEAVFQQVASRRYGLKFCCQVDLNKWWIKKELLDLKSIYDPNACVETPVDCCPPCNVEASILVIQTRGCSAPNNPSTIIVT